MSGAAPSQSGGHRIIIPLLVISDATAAILLAADLLVVCGSVLLRFLFNAPVEWADDVARGLMVGSSFFGAASALARAENLGVAFFIDMLPAGIRRVVDAVGALLVTVISGYVAFNAIKLGWLTTGQTSGSGLPLELTFYPMGAGALFMTVFAANLFCARPVRDIIGGTVATGLIVGLYLAWDFLGPASVPSSGTLMLVGFFITLFGGLPIGFALALAALTFIWVEGTLPGVIFAQQMARGIDNFVLLAIPFFILVGYLMEANGMSVRLIELLQRAVGRMRGGLNVVMVTSMVLFSGISGSKMADVAAVGSVLIPAARRSRQNPGSAVALLAASAVMAETIPPCINLIILGFVANLSIGGLFVAGLLPASLMALALIAVSIIFGKRAASVKEIEPQIPMSGLWSGAIASFGLIFMIFAGFKSGFATATEISAFAVAYAIVIGSLVFRELSFKTAASSFVQAATRSGLVLFIVAAAQSLAFVLTLQQVPHAVGDL
ncbi:MAG TPA: TRAP transporter large permease subunit, partial [Bradyrhizobium sp.]|nr:TRAP transporter large permease subunit [Bradyrhizobium sp.]